MNEKHQPQIPLNGTRRNFSCAKNIQLFHQRTVTSDSIQVRVAHSPAKYKMQILTADNYTIMRHTDMYNKHNMKIQTIKKTNVIISLFTSYKFTIFTNAHMTQTAKLKAFMC